MIAFCFFQNATHSVARDLQISNVHNHQPVFFDMPTLVFGTCSQLELVSVLGEAREVVTISRQCGLGVIDSAVRHQDADDCRAIQH